MAFSKTTEQEVAVLVDALGLAPGMRVVNVGCGPRRHSHPIKERGLRSSRGSDRFTWRCAVRSRREAPVKEPDEFPAPTGCWRWS